MFLAIVAGLIAAVISDSLRLTVLVFIFMVVAWPEVERYIS